MKKTTIVSFILLTVSFPVFGTMLYTQNFDTAGQTALIAQGPGGKAVAPTGWQIWANNADTASALTVSDGSSAVWGGNYTGYYASADGQDFSLGIHKSSTGAFNAISFTYTAASEVTHISGSFDIEAPWSRYTGATARSASFNNGFRYAVNTSANNGTRGYAWGTPLTGGLTVNNAQVDSAASWFTDDQMDQTGLSIRHVTFDIPNLTLSAGQSLTLAWFSDYNGGGANYKNMLIGVDNFSLQGIPEPTTFALFALAGLLLPRRRQT